MHARARLFAAIPRGTTLTLVMEAADTALAEFVPGSTVKVAGTLLGVESAGSAEPKVRLLTATRQGAEYEAVYNVHSIVRVENLKRARAA